MQSCIENLTFLILIIWFGHLCLEIYDLNFWVNLSDCYCNFMFLDVWEIISPARFFEKLSAMLWFFIHFSSMFWLMTIIARVQFKNHISITFISFNIIIVLKNGIQFIYEKVKLIEFSLGIEIWTFIKLKIFLIFISMHLNWCMKILSSTDSH
jgi:hypothetical protein